MASGLSPVRHRVAEVQVVQPPDVRLIKIVVSLPAYARTHGQAVRVFLRGVVPTESLRSGRLTLEECFGTVNVFLLYPALGRTKYTAYMCRLPLPLPKPAPAQTVPRLNQLA